MAERKRKAPSEGSKLESKSPAEFFANNKNIAGFDNPGKSLYTTVREFVENSLDAAESIGVLPVIQLTIEEIDQAAFHSLIGLTEQSRKNEALYTQDDKPKKRQKTDSKKSKDISVVALPIELNDEADEDALLREKGQKEKEKEKCRGKTMYYRVTVKDNGSGMKHDDIPNMLGRVLSGTKYGVKQARGRFGLGAKMALIWSKMSTGRPIEVRSATSETSQISRCVLDIDIYKNQPHIIAHDKEPNASGFRGTEISVIIEGSWTSYRAKILQYMRQMAVITPYAEFQFRFQTPAESKSFAIRYARRSDAMPPVPAEVKHHPSSVNLIVLKKLIQDAAKCDIRKFLRTQFSGIDAQHAQKIADELGGDYQDKPVSTLADQQIVRILQLFKELKFDTPDGSCLSPAGEYNLRLGVMKELKPDMVATFQEPTRVFEGHPFIVEAAVSLGGKTVKPGLNVYRYANRIPLLFEAGGDVVTRTVLKKINWTVYKIKPNVDKLGVFVSLVSTKIPFKGTGKEYIGDDVEEIGAAVKHAIQQCCLQLKVKLMRQAALRDRQERKQNLTKYIPNVSKAVFEVLAKIAAAKDDDDRPQERMRYDQGLLRVSLFATDNPTVDIIPERELLRKVTIGEVTQNVLHKKLVEHVDQTDIEQAFEYVASNNAHQQQKLDDAHLLPLDEARHMREITHPTCVLSLFIGAELEYMED
eukprot:Opistho-2@71290